MEAGHEPSLVASHKNIFHSQDLHGANACYLGTGSRDNYYNILCESEDE